MADDNEDIEKPSKLVLYVGKDLSFLEDLESKYKDLSSSTGAVFQQIFDGTPEGAQSLIIKIRELRPKIVIIDYSKNALALLHLTRVWLRQNSGTNTNLIGVCDYAQGSSIILKSIMTTIKCVHIKSSELEAICFDINILAFPDKAQAHGFATAKLSEPLTICYPAKAAYVQESEIRIESDIDLAQTQGFRFHNYWSKNEIIHSPEVELKTQTSEGLFYNYKYAQILNLTHASEVTTDDSLSAQELDVLRQRHTEEVESSQEKLSFWIQNHIEHSKPKFLKALIVDKSDCIFQDRPISDQYDFIFRTQSYLVNPKEETLKLEPHIIIYHLEEIPEETLSANQDIAHTFNTVKALKQLISDISSAKVKYEPYIIAFNTIDQSTEQLQKSLGYKNIIAITDTMDVELVLKMCQLLKAKIEPTLKELVSNTVYIDKNSDVSYGEIEGQITLLAISENDIYFDSELDIPEKTVFRMFITHSFYVTVMPMPGFARAEAKYYGIVHGIGEIERKALRQFINNIFFKDLESKKALEAQEVEKTKEKFLSDRGKSEEKEKEKKKADEEKEKKLTERASELVAEVEAKQSAKEDK